MFLVIGFFFIFFDRFGIFVVEFDVGGLVYWIYLSWNFFEVVVEGEERKIFFFFLGKNIIEVCGEVIVVYLVLRCFFFFVLIEFEGEKFKLV